MARIRNSTVAGQCSRRLRKSTMELVQLTIFCALLLLQLPGSSTAEQIEANDIEAFLNALDSSAESKKDTYNTITEIKSSEKSAAWGIPDAVATVGKLFKYELPKGDHVQMATFKVWELGRDVLPSWLELEPSTNSLQGVPGPEHAGMQHYLEVVAMETMAEQALARARDMFTVHVSEDKVQADATAPVAIAANHAHEELRPIKCPVGSSVTAASIIVDVDLGMLKPLQKASLVKDMCSYLQMPMDMLKLLPVGNKPMFDSSALVAGPGDVKNPETPGAIMRWEVGCGNVYANHMPILQNLESTSNNGSMSDAVGHGIIGWHVTNNKVNAPRRLKRQVRIQSTPTPQPSVGPPTRQPVPTRVIPSEETDGPTDRVVVTMSSPSFPNEIKPTSRKHHHNHRTKTKGRHSKHHKTPKASPKHTKTAMPIPPGLPIQPTSVSHVMPTKEVDMTRETPTEPMPSPALTPTADVIQPSMTPPLPGFTSTSKATEILPTRPVELPDVITTQPIEPTRTDDTSTASTTTPKEGPIWPIEPPEITTEPVFNYAPIVKNEIQRLEAEVGQVFDYRIPRDTFNDHEDGNTRHLKLELLTIDKMTITSDSWVKFDQKHQRLYGLPMADHRGRTEYIMMAIDSQAKIARNPFEIIVRARPMDRPINHELSVTLDLNYASFIMDVDKRIDVANKVASVFGDKDGRHMTVTKIESGSVIYAWTNNSLPVKPCPTRDIAHLVSFLLTENNTLREEAVEKLKPYRILKAGAERKGECAEDGERVTGVSSDDTDPKEVASKPRETSDNDILITTVVPAVIIAAMLLLAALIACILYRTKRKGKLSDEDQRTFINKGIPIIFADELEDKPDPSSKPLIMAEEKPPLPPPEYPRSNGGSAPSSPGSNHKEPLLDLGDEDDPASTPYQPPPPLTGTNGSRGPRPRAAQQYRQPYVQP